jgi:hypothetical protein
MGWLWTGADTIGESQSHFRVMVTNCCCLHCEVCAMAEETVRHQETAD